MRRSALALGFSLLSFLAPPVAAHAAVETYTPPSEPGTIYTVIDYRRADATNQSTTIIVSWNGQVRKITVAAPYAANACSTSSPAGIVLKIRHPTADPSPLRIRTDGTVVQRPVQGELPIEVLHACYKIQT